MQGRTFARISYPRGCAGMRVPALRAKSMNSDFAKTFLNNMRSGQRAPGSQREQVPEALRRY